MPAYIADLEQQVRPDREGYDRYDVAIASAELPCGAAWLASCLLEIGVPLWKAWGIDDTASWRKIRGNRWRYSFPGSAWSRVVPGLFDGRSLRLLNKPVPQFTHAWPGQLPLPPKLILFLRDPRDALHSNWQRECRAGIVPQRSLSEFLTSPTPGLQLPPRLWLGYFLAAWKAASMLRPTLIVRFEDAKLRPVATLRRVVEFLDLRLPARTLVRATRASSHARIVAAEQSLLCNGVVRTGIVGTGTPYAFRFRDPGEQVVLDARLAGLARYFGYEDAVAGSVEDAHEGDLADHLLATLRQSSADPGLLEFCLNAATAE